MIHSAHVEDINTGTKIKFPFWNFQGYYCLFTSSFLFLPKLHVFNIFWRISNVRVLKDLYNSLSAVQYLKICTILCLQCIYSSFNERLGCKRKIRSWLFCFIFILKDVNTYFSIWFIDFMRIRLISLLKLYTPWWGMRESHSATRIRLFSL